MTTKKERIEKLIKERKNNIKLYENILKGKVSEYKKYMNDNTFITDVTKRLKLEKELLYDLEAESILNTYAIYVDIGNNEREEYHYEANNIEEALGKFFMENENFTYMDIIDHMEI